ncbi:uncharacterized protein IL334_007533 [Kwoniella shivajii]|uniref:Major facilitator superfamily (MFS) profile domain-containing protein n=1 Tax=Kwoniella shivajii TaxID=564305 RepID=A0ABZ1DB23_9TREE|nr:hypothetical protein IL334_007533 [Kwoniella shivajii]
MSDNRKINPVANSNDTPSSSTSTLRDRDQPSHQSVEDKMSIGQRKESKVGVGVGLDAENDVKSKDFGMDEIEIEINDLKPIEMESKYGITQDKSNSISRTGNNVKNALGKGNDNEDEDEDENEKGLVESQTETKTKGIEMIDGRPRDIYDRYTKSQRNRILFIVSYSAIIAPMSSSIFLPSIPQMAEELNTTPEVINYTVAVFILVIGIAPVLWSPYAGFYGRRPIYLASMPIMVVASIGVAVSKSVAGMTAARVIQAIGSSCFLSVGAGSVGDVFRPTERSRGMSLFYMMALLGPAVSPALAGVFSEYTPAGWRSCQYFLAGMGTLSVVMVYFWLPETSHPPLAHDVLKLEKGKSFVWYWSNPVRCMGLIRWPNIAVACFISSVTMIDTYCVLVPLSSVFKERYNINNLAIGGCLYLVNGAGNIIGSKVIGPWADSTVKKYMEKRGYRRPEDRLKAAFLGLMVIMPLSCIIYGWVLNFNAGGMAPPLIMVFFNGVGLMFSLAPLNTYLVDGMQTRSAEVIAVNNCVRYFFAAGASACILPIANSIGWGWTMTICTILTIMAGFSLWLLCKYGDKWRENANMKYGITSKQADEERVDNGEDEESAIKNESDITATTTNTNPTGTSCGDGDLIDNQEKIENPIELDRIQSTTARNKIRPGPGPGPGLNGTGIRRNTSTRHKGELPNVEQVLKRTVSLSGASVHGGG